MISIFSLRNTYIWNHFAFEKLSLINLLFNSWLKKERWSERLLKKVSQYEIKFDQNQIKICYIFELKILNGHMQNDTYTNSIIDDMKKQKGCYKMLYLMYF